MSFTTGDSAAGRAGDVIVSAGLSSADLGASVSIVAGSTLLTSSTTVNVEEITTGGDVSLAAGSGGNGGFVRIEGGAGVAEQGGDIMVVGGKSLGSSSGGRVALVGGLADGQTLSAIGGNVDVVGGSSANASGGRVLVSSGVGITNGVPSSAAAVVTTPDASVSGAVNVLSGRGNEGSGALTLATGDSDRVAGDINIMAGSSSVAIGGDVVIQSGEVCSVGGKCFLKIVDVTLRVHLIVS